MIAITARPVLPTAAVAKPIRGGLEAFVAAEIARQAAFGHTVQPIPGGFRRLDRPYVALPCHCAALDCPGYAMVHDAPGARAYFQRLFPGGRA